MMMKKSCGFKQKNVYIYKYKTSSRDVVCHCASGDEVINPAGCMYVRMHVCVSIKWV